MRPTEAATKYQLDDLLAALRTRRGNPIRIALDLETTGLDPRKVDITWLSWCLSDTEYGAIPIRHRNPSTKNDDWKAVRDTVQALHRESKNEIAWHNAAYDLAVLKCQGWLTLDDINAQIFDTMLASYLLNPVKAREGGNHKLKTLYDERVREPSKGEERQPDFEAICDGVPFADVPLTSAAFYAAFDAFTTFHLLDILGTDLTQRGLMNYFKQIEIPHLLTTIEITTSGIRLLCSDSEIEDRNKRFPDQAIKSVTEYHEELEKIQSAIFEMTNQTFNLASPDALRRVLFGSELGITPYGKARAGSYLIDKDTLTKIFCDQDGLYERKLLAYILYAKQLMTIISKHTEMIDGSDSLDKSKRSRVIYPKLRATTASGRYAGSSPNMLSLSSSSNIKRHLVPRDGWTFVIGDFSQIDLRVIANETAEVKPSSKMRQDVNSGVDLHLNTLRIVDERVQPNWKKLLKDKADKNKAVGYIDTHGKEYVQPQIEHAMLTTLQKKRGDVAKPLNFGVSYGLGPTKLLSNLNTTDEFREQVIVLPGRGVSEDDWLRDIKAALDRPKHTLRDVKGYLDRFHSEYPDIRTFQEQVEDRLRDCGETHNLFGRPCRAEILPLFHDPILRDKIAFDISFGKNKWFRVRVADIKVEPEGIRCRLKRVNRLQTSEPFGKRKVEKSDLVRTESSKVYEVDEASLLAAWEAYLRSMDPSDLADGLTEAHNEACWDEENFFELVEPDVPALSPDPKYINVLSDIGFACFPYVMISHEAIERVLIDGTDVDLKYPGYDKLRRNLISARVSSTSMDFCKIAMIEFRNIARQRWSNINERPRIVNCIHDEIAVECREEDAEDVRKLLKQCMEDQSIFGRYVDKANGRKLLVEIEAEIGIGNSYAKAKP